MPMSAVLASARKRYGLSARMTAAAATRFRTVARGAASAAGRPGRTCRNRFGLASLASQPPLKALWHQVSDARPRFPAPSAHCGRRRRRRGRTSIDGDMGNAGKCEDVGRPATGSTGPNKGTAPLVYSSTSFCSATACRPELYVPAATGSATSIWSLILECPPGLAPVGVARWAARPGSARIIILGSRDSNAPP